MDYLVDFLMGMGGGTILGTSGIATGAGTAAGATGADRSAAAEPTAGAGTTVGAEISAAAELASDAETGTSGVEIGSTKPLESKELEEQGSKGKRIKSRRWDTRLRSNIGWRRNRYKRKMIFMKYNIPGDKNTSRMQIKEFISFDVIRITYENTLPSPRIKLRSMGSNGRSKT